MDGPLLGFLAVAIVMIVTPGQDTALPIRTTLRGGRRGGVATATGVAAGQACWTLLAALGLTALLVASEPLFLAIRLAGAAYLVFLGLQALWSAIRPAADNALGGATALGTPLAARPAFRSGLLSNLGNPKMALFFSSLLPQFLVPGPSWLVGAVALGLVFVAMTLAWLSLYAVAIDRARGLFRRRHLKRAIDAITGTILLAFGIRLAAEPV
jgi:threonine/homoserine/homoserine lactone efflux protein